MDATEAAAVLARARQGDSDAFRALVEQHSRSVFRLAFRMTGNEQDAEDVVQESFLRAYRQLGRFESRANFGTWLYRIVSNCSVDLMRSKQARHDQVRGDSLDEGAMELPAADVPGPERMAQSAEIDRRVQDALQRVEPARARGVHAAALRRTIDRRNQRDARVGNECGQAQRVSRGQEAARRAGAAAEPGIVTHHFTEDELTLYYYGEGRRRARHRETPRDRARRARPPIARSPARSRWSPRPTRPSAAISTGSKSGSGSGTSCLNGNRSVRRGSQGSQGSRRSEVLERLGFAAAAAMLDRRGLRRAAAPGSDARAGGHDAGEPGDAGEPCSARAPDEPRARRRTVRTGFILLTSVADHLDRSERVLTDIMNAPRGDISAEQRWADDLLDASRLYRQDAIDAGEAIGRQRCSTTSNAA